MADLPRHPEADDDATAMAAGHPSRRSWLPIVVGIAVRALVVLMIVLHLTGTVGAGAH